MLHWSVLPVGLLFYAVMTWGFPNMPPEKRPYLVGFSVLAAWAITSVFRDAYYEDLKEKIEERRKSDSQDTTRGRPPDQEQEERTEPAVLVEEITPTVEYIDCKACGETFPTASACPKCNHEVGVRESGICSFCGHSSKWNQHRISCEGCGKDLPPLDIVETRTDVPICPGCGMGGHHAKQISWRSLSKTYRCSNCGRKW